ncbi:methyltransferase domain-containing protein [Belnapia sp. T18]|uniref:Methyltransferase domain-containing protein n=1 Tax=Belnapia arida TaxID=2804533 RepID=A0ABS1U356_9PROT|nr:methyltransferase [Belnapia arida]MBL6079097.1 methyltransferase domain-containing protein [Belnapia arida]
MSGAMVRPAGLLDRARDTYDRILASPRFRSLAARFPLTRPVARRRVRALFDLCAGFVYSQVLLACVRLRLFEILRDGPEEEACLAARLALPPEAAARLFAAAASLGLLARRGGGRWGLGPLGAAMVDNPGVTAMVEHHALVYGDLADPVALLRRPRGGNHLSGYWPYAGTAAPASLRPEQVAAYTDLMAASQPIIAEEVLAALPLRRHRCLLDVGGGDGSFLRAAGTRHPHLRLMLFDLPAVAERARPRFAAAGMADRASLHGGDVTTDALPQGADILSLVRVIHDHDDDRALAILRAARAALPPGGTLLLAEPMAATRGAEPIGEAYFGFYLLAMGTGRARTPAELSVLLRQAGFTAPRLRPTRTPLLVRVMTAEVVVNP